MAIYLMGDIHGYYDIIAHCNRFVEPDDIIIQVGDFGFDKNTVQAWNQMYPQVKCNVYAIDGNHENYDVINGWPKDKVTRVARKLFYIPRGMVLNLEGIRIGFLGGAESVDKAWRVTNEHSLSRSWWKEERIAEEDVERLVKNVGDQPLDVLVAHCPPPITVLANFPMINTESWGLPSNWVDISSQRVADAIAKVKPKRVFCGHMHKSVTHDVGSHIVRILDIEEVTML